MKIAIEVNGVLRNTIEKFIQVYEKHMIDENSEDFSSTNNIFEIDDSGNTTNYDSEEKFDYKKISEVTTLDLSSHYAFKSKEDYFSFLYEEFPMHIFGHAQSSEMTSFNYLNDFYNDFRNDCDISIISDEIGKSKPATLFFLSKFSCLIEKIIFYNSVTKNNVLNDFDLIVTSNPEIIINYPNKVIKFETGYNKHVDAEISIKSLKELAETIKKIKNAETIQRTLLH